MRKQLAILLTQKTLLAACTLAAWCCVAGGQSAYSQGLTYIDADDALNLTSTDGGAAINSSGTGADNLWGFRGSFFPPVPPAADTRVGSGGFLFESLSEDSPGVKMSLSGIAPGSYDFYAVYWTDSDENWAIRTGMNPGSLTLYNYSGEAGDAPLAGAIPGKVAAGAVWTTPPAPTAGLGTIYTEGPAADPFDRSMLLAKAGTATVTASGEATVYFDDVGVGATPGQRSWLDGVAYVAANTPIALTATLNSATGAISVTNPTSQAFQIKSYAIDSGAGSLDATKWFTITGHVDGSAGGNGTFDTDPWQVTAPVSLTPFVTTVAESEQAGAAAVGGTLAANGGTLSFGNLWTRNRYQDVRITLTLADDTRVILAPEHIGAVIQPADFSANGALGIEDFQVLVTNLHTNTSALTRAAAHLRGDINGDRAVNYADYEAFRVAYDDVFGVGAFAQMVKQVPEPNTLALVALAGVAGLTRLRRKMAFGIGGALVGCLMATTSHAQVLLQVDVNARAGDVAGIPAGPNTVAGFGAFTLTPSTTGALPNSTGVVNGFTVGVVSRRADGTTLTTGGIDDRDRDQPQLLPTLNQLYDDFIFTAAGVGVGGGFDLSISNGGVLQPNKQYSVSIYSYDNSSAGTAVRTADWLDGNSNNLIVTQTAHVGSALPTTDNQYKFTGLARTDASGNLLLKGRNTRTDTQASVILNGFEVAVPVELSLEVNTSNGQIRVLNEQSVPFDMSYYEIRSTAGSLNPTSWTSLDDGEGGDPVGTGWDEAGGSSANILSEVNLTALRSIGVGAPATPLGAGFTPGAMQDIRFLYAAPGGPLRSGLVNYVGAAAIPGDYDNDGDVDSADLADWGRNFSEANGADGDADGDTDGNDFLIWQRNFGRTSSVAAAGAVPEPGAIGLSAIAALLLAGRGFIGRRKS